MTRDKIIECLEIMRRKTVENGCTPAEAAAFAAKVTELIEKYQVTEAELRAARGADPDEVEVCQNTFRTGKKVFNPGVTQVFSGLARGMCCKVILLHQQGEAVYGIVGDALDADFVCQIAASVIPAIQISARLEGAEHGYEKAGLVRWSNQYLTGAGEEIRKRLEKDRKDRSEAKEAQHRLTAGATCTALSLVTGETVALAKRQATEEAFKKMYPRTRTTHSRSEYNHTANQRGREAGRRVGLHLGIE